jgi:hypothetical protein
VVSYVFSVFLSVTESHPRKITNIDFPSSSSPESYFFDLFDADATGHLNIKLQMF